MPAVLPHRLLACSLELAGALNLFPLGVDVAHVPDGFGSRTLTTQQLKVLLGVRAAERQRGYVINLLRVPLRRLARRVTNPGGYAIRIVPTAHATSRPVRQDSFPEAVAPPRAVA